MARTGGLAVCTRASHGLYRESSGSYRRVQQLVPGLPMTHTAGCSGSYWESSGSYWGSSGSYQGFPWFVPGVQWLLPQGAVARTGGRIGNYLFMCVWCGYMQ